MEKHKNDLIVFKIDTEGAEYDIIDNLIASGLINKIDMIMMETHYYPEDKDKHPLHVMNHTLANHGFIVSPEDPNMSNNNDQINKDLCGCIRATRISKK